MNLFNKVSTVYEIAIRESGNTQGGGSMNSASSVDTLGTRPVTPWNNKNISNIAYEGMRDMLNTNTTDGSVTSELTSPGGAQVIGGNEGIPNGKISFLPRQQDTGDTGYAEVIPVKNLGGGGGNNNWRNNNNNGGGGYNPPKKPEVSGFNQALNTANKIVGLMSNIQALGINKVKVRNRGIDLANSAKTTNNQRKLLSIDAGQQQGISASLGGMSKQGIEAERVAGENKILNNTVAVREDFDTKLGGLAKYVGELV